MNLRKLIKNCNGLTLVELLVTIVILSIVLVTFMSIFPQSMKLSKTTEEKLAAINIAEIVLSDFKNNVKNDLKDYEVPYDINGKTLLS